MKRFICWLIGHSWSPWHIQQSGFFVYGDEERKCMRCKKSAIRFRCLPRRIIGDTIRIHMPQRWVVRDSLIERDPLQQSAALADPPSSADGPDLPPVRQSR
jgi:hypothetical protein